jgi:hypothetical protein
LTKDAKTLADVGVQAQALESIAIQFIRHYRSNKWADQPATIAEVKNWDKAAPH